MTEFSSLGSKNPQKTTENEPWEARELFIVLGNRLLNKAREIARRSRAYTEKLFDKDSPSHNASCFNQP
jgi:hypothetical protein